MTVESECEMAERHVQEAEERVSRQREIIFEFAQLQKSAYSQRLVENACALLVVYEDSLRLHKAHVARLRSEGRAH